MKKSDLTKKFVEELLIYHVSKMSELNEEYFDQQAFNDFIAQNVKFIEVGKLPPEKFVIGADIPMRILKNRNNLCAIHVNYLKGAQRKVQLMRALTEEKDELRSPVSVAIMSKIMLVEARVKVTIERVWKFSLISKLISILKMFSR